MLQLSAMVHVSESQQTPSATHFPLSRGPHTLPLTKQGVVLSFSAWHTSAWPFPMWHPNSGLQQICGPTHWPEFPGPQPMQGLIAIVVPSNALLPPFGQFLMKHACDKVTVVRRRASEIRICLIVNGENDDEEGE